ncbi:hypothetical protein R3I94_009355 [Phoxinus phoxinus]
MWDRVHFMLPLKWLSKHWRITAAGYGPRNPQGEESCHSLPPSFPSLSALIRSHDCCSSPHLRFSVQAGLEPGSSDRRGQAQPTEPLALPHQLCFFWGHVFIMWTKPVKLKHFNTKSGIRTRIFPTEENTLSPLSHRSFHTCNAFWGTCLYYLPLFIIIIIIYNQEGFEARVSDSLSHWSSNSSAFLFVLIDQSNQ